MLFFFIGMLISSWMASGVPTFTAFALELVTAIILFNRIYRDRHHWDEYRQFNNRFHDLNRFYECHSALGFSFPLQQESYPGVFGDKMSSFDTTNLAS